MFKNIIFSLLLLVLGNNLNAAAGGASSATNYGAFAAQQKLEIWHDVQPASFYGKLPISIVLAIEGYQGIPKDKRGWLKQRIDALQNITTVTNDPRNLAIILLRQTATNKAIYLQGILDQQPFLKVFRLEETPAAPAGVTAAASPSPKLRSGLGVQNSYLMGGDHGEFIPHLDPAFRTKETIQAAVQLWQRALEKNATLPEFYLWLETRPDLAFKTEPAVQRSGLVGRALIKARRVYFDETGKAYNALYGDKTKASKIFDGAACWPVKPTAGSQGYLYNIDKDGNLYIGALEDTPQHSYILRGKLTQSAGYVKFDSDGFMTSIDTSSGHYTPSATSFKVALDLLVRNNNANIFSKTYSFGYYNRQGGGATTVLARDMIPDLKKSLYPNGISGNDLLKLKDSFTPTELQEMVPDPFEPNTKITLQALLQKLQDNTPAYMAWLASKDTRDAHLQKLEQILYHGIYTISTPNDPVLLAALKKYALSIIPADRSDVSELQKSVRDAGNYSRVFTEIGRICSRSKQSFPWGNRQEDLGKLFPEGDLSNMYKLKIILRFADPSLDILNIEGTKYTINGAMQYYASIGDEIKKIKAEDIQITRPFEVPLVTTPALMAVLKRQSQAYRVKLAIKDNLPNLRARAQTMKADPALLARMQEGILARNKPKRETIAAAKAEAARIAAAAEAARQAEEAAEAARKAAEEEARQSSARAEAARKRAEEAAAAEAVATAAAHKAAAEAAAKAEADRRAAEAAAAEAAARVAAEEAATRKAAEDLKEARYRQFVQENDPNSLWSILATAGPATRRTVFTPEEIAEFQPKMQREIANRPTQATIQYGDDDLSDDDISAV